MVRKVTSPKKESPKISTAAEWKAKTSKEKTQVTTSGIYESMKHLSETGARFKQQLSWSVKNNSSNYTYLKNENGQDKLDKNGRLIVDHDLHNHDGELPDSITEAFIE